MSSSVGEVYDVSRDYRTIRDVLHSLSQLQITAEEVLTYCFEEIQYGVKLESTLDDFYAALHFPWEQQLLEQALEMGRSAVARLIECIPALKAGQYDQIVITALGYAIVKRR